jgi:hypothetical protein
MCARAKNPDPRGHQPDRVEKKSEQPVEEKDALRKAIDQG